MPDNNAQMAQCAALCNCVGVSVGGGGGGGGF